MAFVSTILLSIASLNRAAPRRSLQAMARRLIAITKIATSVLLRIAIDISQRNSIALRARRFPLGHPVKIYVNTRNLDVDSKTAAEAGWYYF